MRTVRTVERALTLLRTIAAGPSPMTFGELHRVSGLPKASVHNLLSTLEVAGFVRLAHHAISGRPIGDPVAEPGDRGDELVAEHHRRVRRVPIGPHVQVGAADSGVPDGQYRSQRGTE